MTGIRDKTALPVEGRLQARNHAIKSACKLHEFIVAAQVQALVQVLLADAPCRSGDGGHGPHGAIRQPEPAKESEHEHSQAPEEQRARQAMLLADQVARAAYHEVSQLDPV